MELTIGTKVQTETARFIINMIYESDVLNRVNWEIIRKSIQDSFPYTTITPWHFSPPGATKIPHEGNEDYTVYGFHALCRKLPKRWLETKLCYRLRRLGW